MSQHKIMHQDGSTSYMIDSSNAPVMVTPYNSNKCAFIQTFDNSVLIEVDGLTITVDKNLKVIVSPK